MTPAQAKRLSHLDALIDVTQDAVIFIDDSGAITRFNGAAAVMFGYTESEALGKNITMLMAEPYAQEHDQYIKRYQQTGEKRAIGMIREVFGKRRNGEEFPLELSVAEFPEGGPSHYGAFLRDVTERHHEKRQLVERERLATVGLAAATLAHEVGNPLNNIHLRAQSLERRLGKLGIDDERITTGVKTIRNEIARLNSLLDEFRLLARPQRLDLGEHDVVSLLREIATVELEAADGRVQLVDELDESMPPLQIDKGRMAQVFLNLCRNAVEAMPKGGSLTLRSRLIDNEHLQLCIADSGPGIDKSVRLFEPFSTTKREGSGLGLPVCRRIVSAHQGEISYETSSAGTLFCITLPLTQAVLQGERSG